MIVRRGVSWLLCADYLMLVIVVIFIHSFDSHFSLYTFIYSIITPKLTTYTQTLLPVELPLE